MSHQKRTKRARKLQLCSRLLLWSQIHNKINHNLIKIRLRSSIVLLMHHSISQSNHMNMNQAQSRVMRKKGAKSNKKRKMASVRRSRTPWLLPQFNSRSIRRAGSSKEWSRLVEFRSLHPNQPLKTTDSPTISPRNSRQHLAVLQNKRKSKYRKILQTSRARNCCGSSGTRI